MDQTRKKQKASVPQDKEMPARSARSPSPLHHVVRPAPAALSRPDWLEKVTNLEQEIAGLHFRQARIDAEHNVLMGRNARSWKSYVRAALRRRVKFTPQAGYDIQALKAPEGAFTVLGDDPQIVLESKRRRLPYGWTCLRMTAHTTNKRKLALRLYYDFGYGFSEQLSTSLPTIWEGFKLYCVHYLPPYVQNLRLDPELKVGDTFVLKDISFQEITKHEALARLAVGSVQGAPSKRMKLRQGMNVARSVARLGLGDTVTHLVDKARGTKPAYAAWLSAYGAITDADKQAMSARIAQMPYRPKFSILMPVYNVDRHYLCEAIDSVLKQVYQDWELCIADDCSTKPHIKRVLDLYAAKDPRIKVLYRPINGHISASSNSALSLATGTYVGLLDHDDALTEHALYMMAEELNVHPDAQVIYSDEDKIDEHGVRFNPYFKPGWNPELLYSQNYVCHFGVYKRDLLQAIGGFRAGYEGSQDYDLILRASEMAQAENIRHVPHILYHWRAIPGSAALSSEGKPYAYEAALRALSSHFERTRQGGQVEHHPQTLGLYRIRFPLPKQPPKVSLLIPTRDGARLLERCIDTILTKTNYSNFEIVIVDNQSQDATTHALFRKLERHNDIRIITYDAPFNYSAINNAAAAAACGSVLGLLNNDLEVIEAEWLEEMVSHAMRPAIGAVGAKLYYPNRVIQHGGVLLGVAGLAGHAHKYCPAWDHGYFGRASLLQAFSAVTGACLVVRKDRFNEVGGLDVRLPVAYNDVDFCLRLMQQGYRNIWTPFAELIHHESASRGTDTTPRKAARLRADTQEMRRRWGPMLADDPYYNPNLSFEFEDFSLAFPPRAVKPWATLPPA